MVMIERVAEAKPPKVRLQNLQTLEFRDAPFFPETLQRRTSVRYARPNPFGSSHSPLQYTGTDNHVVQLSFEMIPRSRRDVDDIDEFVRFCESLEYGPSTVGIDGAFMVAPPEVLLIWPENLALVGRIENFEESIDRFFSSGKGRRRAVSMTFVETPGKRITQAAVRELGGRRGGPRLA
jgi:hypothetical protein